MDTYKLALTLVGLALLGAAWLPHLLKRQPLTFPMLYVAVGAALYALPLPLPPADPMRFPVVAEHLTELAVLVALVGAGLRIDTVFGWRRWRLTWRLLAITMPLTIAAGAVLGQQLLGYGVAAAMLLGAVLAPTDPVLASDVQVHAPGKGGEDPVRFALTSEAGLNDGLAFPFVWLAVALAAAATGGEPMQWQRWLLLDALWRVVAGAGIGWLVGYALMHLIFRSQRSPRISAGSDGLTALAITLFVYGVAELCGGYGFLAVFVAAVVVRQHERNHEYHTTLNLFAEQCERLLMALLLILFGGVLVSGQLGMPTLREWGFALAFVLLVRPLAGWLGMAGSGLRQGDQWAIAVFGVRGIGSLYYLAFAINHADFPEAERLWSVVCLVVLLSILLHGISAKPAMGWLDRRRQRRQRASG
ncbi:cation:proton antiporter [Pseudoxanthomonas wuyuanensis]|uniref:Sodium/proton antiporter, CPA1 family n=1 Tax=Pseudoxanthomonas wuyuanensis TaxID=1073196 RepID=A0A286DBB6_9GAMM|nr:cation:proton antiporter [Pseudoxanthomonas wuyuanensis]KAF1721764.1 cation transporter [Pseudoxanthomonas wuyuanensis]SOD55937.1 sodium/proton antiporter, CPA1 family [Pseudoxanthomonas wuyuanensis]